MALAKINMLTRLIPARAGNTSCAVSVLSPLSAHPRSRGEHHIRAHTCINARGSSPLARGTLIVVSVQNRVCRLIPARAGNTIRALSLRAYTTAHPRSRGEHTLFDTSTRTPPGSSPLARGTPADKNGLRRYGRLIPARAGNTHVFVHRIQGQPAHPRSRGEHRHNEYVLRGIPGSSPLARGTLSVGAVLFSLLRLIPARAGNTGVFYFFTAPTPAHPRSRGEHSMRIPPRADTAGSSPLARGTPCSWCSCIGVFRLIPARAGNTIRLG